MQLVTLVGVARDERFVQLDAESRLPRRNHVPGLPTDGLDEHVRVKPLPALDTFEDQEVRAAGGELDVGGADHRSAIKMRRELRSEERRVGKECRDRGRADQERNNEREE